MTIKKSPRRKKSAKNKTIVALILDRSGSMSYVVPATVAGFNEQVKTIKANAAKTDTKVCLALFNGLVTTPLWLKSPDELSELHTSDYVPMGSTAMYDGIGSVIDRLIRDVTDDDNTSYLVVLLTDGQENASTHYTAAQINERVNKLQASGRWSFAVVGANINLADLSVITGIPTSNMRSYVPDSVGTARAMRGVAEGVASYMTMRETGAQSSNNVFAGTEIDADKVTP